MILEVEIPCVFVFSPGEVSYIRKRCLVEKIRWFRVYMDDTQHQWRTELVIKRQPVTIPCTKPATDFVFNHIMHYPTLEEINNDITDDVYTEAQSKTLLEIRDIWAAALYLQCDDFVDIMRELMLRKLDGMSDEDADAFFASPKGQCLERNMLEYWRSKKRQKEREREMEEREAAARLAVAQ